MPRQAGALLGVLLVVGATAARADFTDVATEAGVQLSGIKDGGLTWADFDGDGDLDLLVNMNNQSRLFFSNGDTPPTFEDVTMALAPGLMRNAAERAAVAADFDDDGYIDFARTGQTRLEVYLNGGPGTTPPFRFGTASGDPNFRSDSSTDPDLDAYEGLGVFDWDGDGWLDFVLDNDDEIRLYRNLADGTGAFELLPTSESGLPPHAAGNSDYITVGDSTATVASTSRTARRTCPSSTSSRRTGASAPSTFPRRARRTATVAGSPSATSTRTATSTSSTRAGRARA